MDSKEANPFNSTIPPNGSTFLDFPSESILSITSLAFGTVKSNSPSQIKVNINTIIDDDCTDECSTKSNEVELGTLIPNECEKLQVDIKFSPLDVIEVHNNGPNEVHISGFLEPLPSDNDAEEEEEEEKLEEIIEEPDVIQSRFSKMAENQPPKPMFKKKKKKEPKKEYYGFEGIINEAQAQLEEQNKE